MSETKTRAQVATAPTPAGILPGDDPMLLCLREIRSAIIKFLSLPPTEEDREGMFIHLRQEIDNLDSARR